MPMPYDPSLPIACVDVDYRDQDAVAACVVFSPWEAEVALEEQVSRIHNVQPYQPGAFYLRELPCLQAVLAQVQHPIGTIVVDGYVWLGPGRAGLGARLFDARGHAQAVVGVAKTAFRGATNAVEVVRGTGHRPLYVTAAGMDASDAADRVKNMHGPFRVPTLLRRVDRLCRDS